MHGSHQYLRATAKDWALEREKHRKAARLALDTSAHAGSEYHNFMRDSYNKVWSCWGSLEACFWSTATPGCFWVEMLP